MIMGVAWDFYPIYLERNQRGFSTMSKPLITPAEAAILCGVSTHTLAEWRRLKKGPPYVRPKNSRPKYDPEVLEAWKKANTITPEAA